MNELDNAEQALIEANYLNNRNPKVWAYLSLICLKTDRQQVAEQSYKYAIKVRWYVLQPDKLFEWNLARYVLAGQPKDASLYIFTNIAFLNGLCCFDFKFSWQTGCLHVFHIGKFVIY